MNKEYSLTDCISINAMKSESIEEILTNDHHFGQEGFRVLIKR
jgi:predicted nucleic acid-binding protein